MAGEGQRPGAVKISRGEVSGVLSLEDICSGHRTGSGDCRTIRATSG